MSVTASDTGSSFDELDDVESQWTHHVQVKRDLTSVIVDETSINEDQDHMMMLSDELLERIMTYCCTGGTIGALAKTCVRLSEVSRSQVITDQLCAEFHIDTGGPRESVSREGFIEKYLPLKKRAQRVGDEWLMDARQSLKVRGVVAKVIRVCLHTGLHDILSIILLIVGSALVVANLDHVESNGAADMIPWHIAFLPFLLFTLLSLLRLLTGSAFLQQLYTTKSHPCLGLYFQLSWELVPFPLGLHMFSVFFCSLTVELPTAKVRLLIANSLLLVQICLAMIQFTLRPTYHIIMIVPSLLICAVVVESLVSGCGRDSLLKIHMAQRHLDRGLKLFRVTAAVLMFLFGNFLVLSAAKLDGFFLHSWWVVYSPLWVAFILTLAIPWLIAFLYSTCLRAFFVRMFGVDDHIRTALMWLPLGYWLPIFAPLFTWCMLLVQALEGGLKISFAIACVPLWILLVALLLTTIITSGAIFCGQL